MNGCPDCAAFTKAVGGLLLAAMGLMYGFWPDVPAALAEQAKQHEKDKAAAISAVLSSYVKDATIAPGESMTLVVGPPSDGGEAPTSTIKAGACPAAPAPAPNAAIPELRPDVLIPAAVQRQLNSVPMTGTPVWDMPSYRPSLGLGRPSPAVENDVTLIPFKLSPPSPTLPKIGLAPVSELLIADAADDTTLWPTLSPIVFNDAIPLDTPQIQAGDVSIAPLRPVPAPGALGLLFGAFTAVALMRLA